MNFKNLIIAFVLGLFSVASFATTTPTNNFLPPLVLRSGTSIWLEVSEEVYANDVSIGNAIRFEVRNDVKVGNKKTVVAAGTAAMGRVKRVQKDCCGKGLKITVTVEEVEAIDGTIVRLEGRDYVLEGMRCEGPCDKELIIQIGTAITARVRGDHQIMD